MKIALRELSFVMKDGTMKSVNDNNVVRLEYLDDDFEWDELDHVGELDEKYMDGREIRFTTKTKLGSEVRHSLPNANIVYSVYMEATQEELDAGQSKE